MTEPGLDALAPGVVNERTPACRHGAGGARLGFPMAALCGLLCALSSWPRMIQLSQLESLNHISPSRGILFMSL
jgi:hypothetical protein